jgi:broad specificity phosphatase PhoE
VMASGQWDSDIPIEEFHDTVFESVERLIAAHAGQKIAVVCHGGVINAYVASILGLPKSAGFFMPDYTSVHRVMAAKNGTRSLRSLNETHHLRGTGLLSR